MGKIFKYVGIGLSVVVVICVGGMLAFAAFFDANDYKDKISLAASKKLGHQVELKGKVEANYFPWLGLKAFDVIIHASNDVSNKQLANVDEMSFKVKTLPLLHKEVLLDKIFVKNAAIHLERNASGKSNWEPKFEKVIFEAPAQAVEPSEQSTQNQSEAPLDKKKEKLSLQISGVELLDSQITYHDKQSKQKFELLDITITTKMIKENAPIDISGHFAMHMSDDKNQLGNTTDFAGTLSYEAGFENFKLENVDLKTELTGEKLPISPLNAQLKGDIEGNLAASNIAFKEISLDVDQSHATGDAVFSWVKNPHVDFNLEVDKILASRYAFAPTNDTTQLALNDEQTGINSSNPIVHVAYEPSNPGLTYKGKLKLGHLEAQKLTFKNISLTASSHANGIQLNPFKADLYNGTFDGESLVNLKNNSTSIKGQLKKIQVESLLKALSGKAQLTGTGNATVNLLVDKRGLNGTTSIQIYKGYIDGVDIDYYLKMARVQLKSIQQFLGDTSLDDFSSDKTSDKKRTHYDSITGTLYANNNYLTNNDLKLDAPDFYALGDGSIDLNKNYLAYKFIAHRKYKDNQDHSHALPLSVRVKGPFNDIKVTPDIDAYLQSVVEKEAKGHLEKEAGKQLNKLFGGDGQDASKPIEDQLKDKLEDELKNKFKKLF